MEAPKAEQVKGRALTCMVCKGSLLLNGESLKQHLGSKKHLKQLKLFNAFLDPICFAGNLDDDSSGISSQLHLKVQPVSLLLTGTSVLSEAA